MIAQLGPSQPKVERLGGADAEAFRELRLEGLKKHPEAFGASWAEEASLSTGDFERRLNSSAVFGVRNADQTLDGVVGFFVIGGEKQRHKGVLWGMYVRPEMRNLGIGWALVRQVITYAKPTVEELRLTVLPSNETARRLYSRAGFEKYGTEPRALKLGDIYLNEDLMALKLR